MAKRLPLSEFKKIYSKVPRLCVDVVVQNEDGVLLTKRSIPAAKGFWHIPGGTVLLHENLEEAVNRVAREEFGLEVEVVKLLGAVEFTNYRSTINGHAVSLPHLVKVISGKIKLNNEASDYGFFKNMPTKTIPEHKKFLEELLANVQGPGVEPG